MATMKILTPITECCEFIRNDRTSIVLSSPYSVHLQYSSHLSFHNLVLISFLVFACAAAEHFIEWQFLNPWHTVLDTLGIESIERNNRTMIWKTIHKADMELKHGPFVNTEKVN